MHKTLRPGRTYHVTKGPGDELRVKELDRKGNTLLDDDELIPSAWEIESTRSVDAGLDDIEIPEEGVFVTRLSKLARPSRWFKSSAGLSVHQVRRRQILSELTLTGGYVTGRTIHHRGHTVVDPGALVSKSIADYEPVEPINVPDILVDTGTATFAYSKMGNLWELKIEEDPETRQDIRERCFHLVKGTTIDLVEPPTSMHGGLSRKFNRLYLPDEDDNAGIVIQVIAESNDFPALMQRMSPYIRLTTSRNPFEMEQMLEDLAQDEIQPVGEVLTEIHEVVVRGEQSREDERALNYYLQKLAKRVVPGMPGQ